VTRPPSSGSPPNPTVEATLADATPRVLVAARLEPAPLTRRAFLEKTSRAAAATAAGAVVSACAERSEVEVWVDDGACTCHVVCTCDVVSEDQSSEWEAEWLDDECICDTVCTCNTVCSCDSHSSGGGGGSSSYWYPN
jgi:hypothetical protein